MNDPGSKNRDAEDMKNSKRVINWANPTEH